MQAVIGTGSGTTYQFELDENQVQALSGLKIGDEVEGSLLGLDGYTLQITGGSDREGFPMRDGVEGTGRRKVMLTRETGGKNLEAGERRRKSVRGNTVSEEIEQLNLKVVEEGSAPVEELLETEEDIAEEEE